MFFEIVNNSATILDIAVKPEYQGQGTGSKLIDFIFNSFNARTNRLNILSNLIKNRVFIFIISLILVIQLLLIYYGGTIFRTSGLTLKELFIMILISSTVIPVDFIRKYILKKKGINTGV